MNEHVKIVQFMMGEAEASDYCLDEEGNIYKIEYSGRNEITLIKQTILVVNP